MFEVGDIVSLIGRQGDKYKIITMNGDYAVLRNIKSPNSTLNFKSSLNYMVLDKSYSRRKKLNKIIKLCTTKIQYQ